VLGRNIYVWYMYGYGMAKTQFQKLKSKLKAATFVTLNLDCCQPEGPKGSLEAILWFLLLIYSRKNNNARTLFVVVVVVIAVLVLVLALSRRRQCLLCSPLKHVWYVSK